MTEEKSEKAAEPAKIFLLFKLDRLEHLAVILGLLTIVGLLRFEAITRLTTHYLGGFQGDAGLYVWLTNLDLKSVFSSWFETPAFYPYGKSLAWSDNFILPALFVKFLLALGAEQPLAFNLTLLLAQFLTGYFAFLLFFRLSGETMNAFALGCIFCSLSYFTYQLGHPQLQFFFCIPLLMLQLFHFLNSGKLRWSFLCGLTLVCCFLTTVYYSIFAAICLAVSLCTILILRPRALPIRRVATLAAGLAAGFLPVIPFLLPYLDVRETFGSRQIYEAFYFSATPLSYLSSTPYNLLYEVTASLSHAEGHFFPGYAVLALSALAIVRLGEARQLRPRLIALFVVFAALFVVLTFWMNPIGRFIAGFLTWALIILFIRLISLLGSLERKLKFETMTVRDLIAIFTSIALVFFILSLGPLGNPEKGQTVFAPYRVLYEIMPGFDSVRAISRCGVVVIYACVFLFALELSHLSARRKLGSALLLPAFFVMIENYSFTYPLEVEPAKPQAVAALEKLNPQDAAVVLPIAGKLDSNNEIVSWSEFARLNTTYFNWLLPSGVHIVNGYSGQRTKLMRELPRDLKGFPDKRSWQAIAKLGGVRYAIYVSGYDQQYDASEFQKRVRESADAVKLLGHFDDGSYLFEIIGALKIDEELYIWLPSRKNSAVSFELRADPNKDKPRVRVESYVKDESDLVQLQNIEIAANGEWQKQSLRLPTGENRVRPIQINFVPLMDAEVYIRNINFYTNVP